jgi:hypothetical protein
MPINEDREAFLEELKEKKQLDEQARIAALKKLQEQGLGQQLVNNHDGLSLNKRRYGPYDIQTTLDQSVGDDHDKVGQIINEVTFRGGEHSEPDMKKVAQEMQEIGKPVNYEEWRNILKGLKPNETSYLESKTSQRTAYPSVHGKPLWYDEKD